MINIFVKRGFSYTWRPYLDEWGGAEQHEFVIHDYEDLADLNQLRAGPIVFTDIERLTPTDRALAADVERVVATERPDIPILNSPTRTSRRYDLLSSLYDEGLNPFRVYRLTDTTTPERFPVFLRYENDHTGAQTGVLHSQAELNRAIVRLRIRQHDLRQFIIVEFCDTSDGDGNYVKYGAFKVGDRIIPKHARTYSKWVAKGVGTRETPEALERDMAYTREGPHESMLLRRFETGAVGYGRIDYSMLGESLVTWEINTNPTIFSTKSKESPAMIPRLELFPPKFSAAFDAIESGGLDPTPVSLDGVPEALRVASRRKHQSKASIFLRFGRKYRRLLEPAVRVVETVSIPFESRIVDRWRRIHGA